MEVAVHRIPATACSSRICRLLSIIKVCNFEKTIYCLLIYLSEFIFGYCFVGVINSYKILLVKAVQPEDIREVHDITTGSSILLEHCRTCTERISKPVLDCQVVVVVVNPYCYFLEVSESFEGVGRAFVIKSLELGEVLLIDTVPVI